MSYDLYLTEPPLSGDVATTLDSLLEAREEDGYRGPRDPAAEAWKSDVASILLALDPELARFQVDYAAVASHLKISEAEARDQWRHIELNGPDGLGLQVTIEDGFAMVTLAYWHSGEPAKAILRRVGSYARALRSRKGLVLFDPQLERVVDLDAEADLLDALASYGGVVARIPEMVAEVQSGKPWWKVW